MSGAAFRFRRLPCLALCLAASAASAAPSAADVTCERFPDADAVTLEEIERVRYRPDGTYEQTDECWTKILTEKGRRAESVLSFGYSRRYGEAAVLEVRATDTNGVERTIDVSATTKESTDNSSVAENIYDPLDRRITCTIPGLKVGETLYVRTMRRATKPRCENKWADLAVMEWKQPILRSTYEVTAPASRPLRQIAIRHPLGNIVTNVTQLADGSLVHTFTATNSAQVFPEPDMPPLYTQVQHIRVSTSERWPEISKWYWDLCAPHLAKTNAAMAAKVGELVAAHPSPDAASTSNAALRAIFRFVSQEIRYMGLTMEDTSPGYAPHDVDVTFDNRYGVCRDKAGLLVAMLRLAGFSAFPVLIHVGAKLDPEVPQPFFNHAIVAVEQPPDPADGRARPYLLMDPTNENTKDLFPSYLGNNSYLVARPEGETLMTSPVPPPEDNALDVTSSATLSRDGSMFFESAILPKGVNDTAYRGALAKRTPDERTRTFERILRTAVPGAELVTCEIEPRDLRDTTVPLSVKLVARLPETVIRGETRDELTVPSLSKSLGVVNWLLDGSTSLDRRKYALALSTTACVRERLTVNLGDALGPVRTLPPEVRTSGGYACSRTFAVTNGVLTMERSLAIAAVEFAPDEYLRLREEIKRVEAAERRKPVFAADAERDAHLRWLLDASETTLFSDHSWVTTNTFVVEVLTYRGKKDIAERKFGYHPSWQRVELVSATVSNRSGQVCSVSPREINVLDSGWASAAPRYPSGRTMVVNLPSVEIGSVVAVKTVTAVTNAPAPYYACCYFDSFSPVDRQVRRIGDFVRDGRPRRLAVEPAQPDGRLWRDCRVIARGSWRQAGAKLARACAVEPPASSPVPRPASVRAVRDWMARYVKVAGPGLYELPLELQLTAPEVVLKERYATRLDYVRTLCALLRGAGHAADVVFAADNAKTAEALRKADREEAPNIRAFATALCRVRVREGGFLGIGGETREIFLGTENEYTPIGATGYDGSDYFDPTAGTFGIVRNDGSRYGARAEETCEIVIRENGSVDMSVRNLAYGAGVGAFRKKFAEILPEDRSRLYQSLLGDIAQAASATSELVTDVEGYPAETRFSCFIPDYATVADGTVSVVLPAFDECLPNLTGTARSTPIAVGATDPLVERVEVRFPAGYTEVEHLPESFAFEGVLANAVGVRTDGDVLTVTVERTTRVPEYRMFAPWYADLVKDWRRRSSSRANRTVVVRRNRDE
ncbi:MAG: DUF3857 domain-containing protein [Kiritimatiellia bacterium]